MREIRPKFLTSEKVFLMSDNKVVTGEILSITTFSNKTELEIKYEVRINRDNFSNTHLEEKLFKTKQELLNSL